MVQKTAASGAQGLAGGFFGGGGGPRSWRGAGGDDDEAEEAKPDDYGGQADVEAGDVGLESKCDLMLAGGQGNAAHDVVAAQKFFWPAVDEHFPGGIVAVV